MFSKLLKTLDFFRPGHNTTAKVYDDMLGEFGLALDEKTKIPSVNMGFWKEISQIKPDSIHHANREMFRIVSEAARFSEEDSHVVDAGCGFATNIKYCIENHCIQKITGLNVSPFQIEWGNRLLNKSGLSHKGEVINGSATDMPFASESIDRVVSIEAAFHFETRETFFEEVKRVLKPGGILSMADLIVCTPKSALQKLFVKSLSKTLHVPKENVYNYEEYVDLAHKSGLEILHIETIGKEVTVPFHKWFWRRPVSEFFNYNLIWSVLGIGFMFARLDYIRIVARKK